MMQIIFYLPTMDGEKIHLRTALKFPECSNLFSFNVELCIRRKFDLFEILINALRPSNLFESFASGERFRPVHSGVICGREKTIEQNKSPNFPALLQQPIWRSDIVEQSAPDKHAANETPRRSRVSIGAGDPSTSLGISKTPAAPTSHILHHVFFHSFIFPSFPFKLSFLFCCFLGGPQTSTTVAHNCHGKRINLTAKRKTSRQKE